MPYQFIPAKIHGALDYVLALMMLFAPMLFKFESADPVAVAIPMITGVALFTYSLFTRYEFGVIKLLSLSHHLILDLIVAGILLISPFIFMFWGDVWWPHVGLGVLLALVVIFSEVPSRRPVTPAM